MRTRRPLALALAAAAMLSAGRPAAADPEDAPDLRAAAWRAAATSAGALALDGLIASRWKPSRCTICGTDADAPGAGKPVDAFDDRARDALVWSDPQRARSASDLLANVAIPVLAVGDALRSTDGWANAGRDVLVVAEAASLTTLATGVAKDGFARIRPGLPAPAGHGAASYQSFWSGHASLAFSVAVAQATEDTMRGDPGAPWAWAVGLALASGVAYLRVAGDAHWATDVLAGAAVGSAFGLAVPRAERALVHGVAIAPAPGGFALRF
jgi:membrane-associated phospholipid phosphatase